MGNKYGENDILKRKRRDIIRGPIRNDFFERFQVGAGFKAKRDIHWAKLILSDIGECEIYVYDSDFASRKPCFYFKAINGPFKTCIELFDNKYVKDAAKNRLTDKQAEELYEQLSSTDIPEYIKNPNQDTTLYESIRDWWIYNNGTCSVFIRSREDSSKTADEFAEKMAEVYKIPMPDYKLINQGESKNDQQKQSRKHRRRRHGRY